MLLPQTKEREYRFKLALRMGLPIFLLVVAFISYYFIDNNTILKPIFLVEGLILLVFSIYFILYLIYTGFDVNITNNVSKTFTREYLYTYLKKQFKKNKEYTLILISIDNLTDINTQYGIGNGDKVLKEVAQWIGDFLIDKKIENFPLGHIKGGDFIVGLDGIEIEYTTMLDLMCLKAEKFTFNDIEIRISGAVSNTIYSRDVDYIIEHLFELKEQNKYSKEEKKEEQLNPNEIESLVLNALQKRALVIMSQNIYENGKIVCKECYIKLKSSKQKMLYPKNYLKVINRLGLTIEYDLMVIEEIIYATEDDKETLYCVNISPTSLRNEKFLKTLKEFLQTQNRKIMLIISEQEYFSHTNRYNNILKSLKQIGVLICISRLGSLNSSFLYLRELDVDYIRFDTYYSNLNKLEKNSNILEGFNLMAHKKGIKTWIKNIEEEQTFTLSNRLNIDYIQGKYLCDLEKVYEN